MDDRRDDTIDQRLRALRRGEPGAAAHLAASLRAPVLRRLEERFGDDALVVHQAGEEALSAAVDYLERDRGFAGDPVRLAGTIATNRARDLARWRRRPPPVDPDSLADWLADPRRSILDEVDPERRLSLLRPALGRLSADCRDLLRVLHVEGRSLETARQRLELATVPNLLYRRAVCLRRVKSYLAERLHGEPMGEDEVAAAPREAAAAAAPPDTPGYTCLDPELGGDLWRLDDVGTDPARRRRLTIHLDFCASCRQQRAVETATEEGLRTGELRLGSGVGRHVRRLRLLAGIGAAALAVGLLIVLFLPPGAGLAGRILGAAGLATAVVSGVLLRRRRKLASALDGTL